MRHRGMLEIVLQAENVSSSISHVDYNKIIR